MAATMATEVRSSEVTTQHMVRGQRLYSKASQLEIHAASAVNNDVGVTLNVQISPELREVQDFSYSNNDVMLAKL